MKKIYNHTMFEGLSKTEKKAIWNLYKVKYPSWRWGFTYFSLIATLACLSLITILIMGQYIGNPLVRLIVCNLIFILVGLGLPFFLVNRILMPKRIKGFHEFLDGKNLDEVILDLKNTE